MWWVCVLVLFMWIMLLFLLNGKVFDIYRILLVIEFGIKGVIGVDVFVGIMVFFGMFLFFLLCFLCIVV